ncbi:MAG: AzlC family ABC transporter permease [Acidimicrobiales bacterium]
MTSSQDDGAHLRSRDGARAMLPLLVGVIPFGIVAGAVAVDNGLGAGAAVASSVIIFAGASQLALYEVLGDGGSAFVAAVAAWSINARLLLYSASLAPHLAGEPLRRRLLVGYLLSDQAYAAAIARYVEEPERGGRTQFVLGAGATLWLSWQAATICGVLVGTSIPADAPIEGVVPLVFLVLLLPMLRTRPAVAAAAVGGTAALIAAQLGAGGLATLIGGLAGVGAGTACDRTDPPA